jgi:hypothetical protein
MAGLTPAGVICEVMNEDGTMARVPDLVQFCAQHELKMLAVAELIRYRLETERSSRLIAPKTAEYADRASMVKCGHVQMQTAKARA